MVSTAAEAPITQRPSQSPPTKGIGPIYASKLVTAFGAEVFEVIEQAPERLREVPVIGKVRAGRIVQAWADQKVVREIMVFLHSHGVGTARAVRIFKTYGNDAVQVMAENPYRLARDIRGIGFRTADAIAARLGIEATAMIRLRAGINYALLEASGEGHCGLPTAELLKLAGELLAVERPAPPPPADPKATQGSDQEGHQDGPAAKPPPQRETPAKRVPLEPAVIQAALDTEATGTPDPGPAGPIRCHQSCRVWVRGQGSDKRRQRCRPAGGPARWHQLV